MRNYRDDLDELEYEHSGFLYYLGKVVGGVLMFAAGFFGMLLLRAVFGF